jgi:MFS family permease
MHWRTLPRGVVALGLVSLLMDTSSELVHSLLPIFLATGLGASMAAIGVIEGVAEAAASFMRMFSGALSDFWRRRKPLVVLGYGLALLAKPLFPLATSAAWVFVGRFADRVGKGIRGAPRDALLADLAPPGARGAAFGLRQSLDSAGAFAGPLLAVGLMAWLAGDIPSALWFAVIPAFLSVVVLVTMVREPPRPDEHGRGRPPWRLSEVRRLSRRFWLVVVLGVLFTLARFSEAFLILRAHDVGLALAWIPLVLVVMNLVFAAVAWPAGAASDRVGRRRLLVGGLAALIAADLAFAGADTIAAVFAGAALWGLHLGLTQGLLSTLVADTAREDLRGSAFGLFNFFGGLAVLAASVIAGLLWARFGAAAAFYAGAAFAAATAAGLLGWRPPRAMPGR